MSKTKVVKIHLPLMDILLITKDTEMENNKSNFTYSFMARIFNFGEVLALLKINY